MQPSVVPQCNQPSSHLAAGTVLTSFKKFVSAEVLCFIQSQSWTSCHLTGYLLWITGGPTDNCNMSVDPSFKSPPMRCGLGILLIARSSSSTWGTQRLSQPRLHMHVVHPACSGSSSGFSPNWKCPDFIHRDVVRRHPNQMPERLQLCPGERRGEGSPTLSSFKLSELLTLSLRVNLDSLWR